MKKLILSGMALLVVTAIFAQHSSTEFGIKAGVNFSNLTDDAGSNTSSRAGINAGGLAHIHINKTFAIQPEVMFSMQGADYGSNVKNRLNYINVPVLGQFMFGDGFRLQTGPQIGFLTSAKSKIGGVEYDSKDEISSTDFSWSFGGGYLTKQGIGFDLRYNLGITDISKDDRGIKNRVWQLGVFYQFHHH